MTTFTESKVEAAAGMAPRSRRRSKRFSLWHLFLFPTALIFALPLL
jgi:hypothetical protein